MKRFVHIAFSVLVWAAIVAYLVWADDLTRRKEGERMVGEVEVVVRDSAVMQVITPAMVRAWLRTEGIDLRNRPIRSVNTAEIERLVARRGFVREASAFVDMRGILHIELSQRHPVARINTANGYNFYVTDDNYILPLQPHAVSYVPIVTGNFTFPFPRDFIGRLEPRTAEGEKKLAENYLFTYKLINFVKFIRNNEFWNAQIEQIDVRGGYDSGSNAVQDNVLDDTQTGVRWREPEIVIVPRAGNHTVILGAIDGAEEKLEKLLLFYRRALDYEGWDAVRTINLRYAGQVVCTR